MDLLEKLLHEEETRVGAMAGVGPWLAGLTFDRTGSYVLVFSALVPVALLAALALATLGPYPTRNGHELD